MKFAVVGNGFVGKATRMFACENGNEISARGNTVIVYDNVPSLCVPIGTTLADVAACDLIFVCVPTPMRADRSCNTSIVEAVVNGVRAHRADAPIVIRSTVPPGTSERLGCAFMPEFLTEKNWARDLVECKLWVFGGDAAAVAVWSEFIDVAHANGCIQNKEKYIASTTACELIKYGRNCFLATKVAFFNELYTLCSKIGVDFEEVRNGIGADSRIGQSHTKVPGIDGLRGFSGTCFPKDINALCAFMRENGAEPHVMAAAIERNETVDRPEHDWMKSERSYLN